MQKTVPNCNVSCANGELHQAYGHVTLNNNNNLNMQTGRLSKKQSYVSASVNVFEYHYGNEVCQLLIGFLQLAQDYDALAWDYN